MRYTLRGREVEIRDEKIPRQMITERIDALQKEYLHEGDRAEDDAIHRENIFRMFEDDYVYLNSLKGYEDLFLRDSKRFKQLIQRGNIYGVNFNVQSVGSEIREYHRALVLTPNNQRSSNVVVVVPLTTAASRAEEIERKRRELSPEDQAKDFELQTMIPVRSDNPELHGYFTIVQIRAVSYARFERDLRNGGRLVQFGKVTADCLTQIERAADSYFGIEAIPKLENTRKAKKENDGKKRLMHIAISGAIDKLNVAKCASLSPETREKYFSEALALLNEVKEL